MTPQVASLLPGTMVWDRGRLCAIEGCERIHEARGWCGLHYSRWKRHGDPLALRVSRTTDGLCLVEGCSRPTRRLGWCNAHYQRWYTHGDPLGEAERVDHRVLFLDHVQVHPSGCWLWTGQLTEAGYGRSAEFGFGTRLAHRIAYEMFVGPIPDGLELDHVRANGCCHNNCVNWVEHLEPVTHEENMRRWRAVTPPIDRCRRAGHLYDEANTMFTTTGRRVCRACDKRPERKAAASARLRAKRAAA